METLGELRIEQVPIGDLRPDAGNPRRISDDELEALTRSIKEFGLVDPIIARREGETVIAGHQRLVAARRLGLKAVPVVFVDISEEQSRLLNLALNRISGDWDNELLARLLADLNAVPDIDLSLSGFGDDELKKLLKSLDARDKRERIESFDLDAALEAAQAQPVARRGDIFLLGDHRLMCGDSTSEADVTALMAGERAVLFATDPPYLVGYDGTNHPHKWNEPDKNKDWSDSYGVTWDDADENKGLYEGFCRVAIAHAIVEDAAWYCWHASRNQAMVEAVWESFGAFVHQQLIWVKDRPILTRSFYMWRHEPVFFGWIRGKKPPRVAEDYPHTVWEVPTVLPGTKTEHPTSKPTKLFEIPMLQHTAEGDLCYEPFSGSGSQIIAAERLDRRCYSMEIEPRYCDVAVRRWEAFTGDKAERIPAEA